MGKNRKFVLCFFLTRAIEAVWFGLVLSGSLVADHALHVDLPNKWKYWTGGNNVFASWIVIAWYYIGFAYLPISAFLLVMARFRGILTSARQYSTFNTVIFVAHSGAVILLMSHGAFALWEAMLVGGVALYNVVVPRILWQMVMPAGAAPRGAD